jgi:DNA-binding XRE family transcriptional regulator
MSAITVGNTTLYRNDGTPVSVRFEKTPDEPFRRFGCFYISKGFDAIDNNGNDKLGRLKLTRTPKSTVKINWFYNDSGFGDKEHPERIAGIGKLLMDCAIAEAFSSKKLKVTASGSFWVYIHFGFEPKLESTGNLIPRFSQSAQLLSSLIELEKLEKQNLIDDPNEVEKLKTIRETFNQKREELAKVLGVPADTLSNEEVALMNKSTMRDIYERSRKQNKLAPDLPIPSLKMYYPEPAFNQWLDQRVPRSLLKFENPEITTHQFRGLPSKAQELICDFCKGEEPKTSTEISQEPVIPKFDREALLLHPLA